MLPVEKAFPRYRIGGRVAATRSCCKMRKILR